MNAAPTHTTGGYTYSLPFPSLPFPSLPFPSLPCLPSLTVAPSTNPVLGIPLNDLLARDGLSIPFIVKKIVKYIEEEGLDQVGLYRINGNVKSIEKLRAAFDKGQNVRTIC